MVKPRTSVTVETTRRASLGLTKEEVEGIVRDAVLARYGVFAGLDVECEIDCGSYEGCRFSCVVKGSKVETTDVAP